MQQPPRQIDKRPDAWLVCVSGDCFTAEVQESWKEVKTNMCNTGQI